MLCQVTGYIDYSFTFVCFLFCRVENDFFLASIRAVILTVIQKKGETNKSLKKKERNLGTLVFGFCGDVSTFTAALLSDMN